MTQRSDGPPHSWCQRLAWITGTPTGVGLGTSSVAARKVAALELMEKLEAPGLHDPEAVGAKRRCLEELGRLVAALPPGKPQRPPLPQCLSLLPRPSLSMSRLRLHCMQHQHPLWNFSCGNTCALSPASDVGLGKVLYSVPCRDAWLDVGVHTLHFTVCKRRVLSAEHQVRVIWVSSCAAKTPVQWRSSRVRGSSSIARVARPGATRRIVRLSET